MKARMRIPAPRRQDGVGIVTAIFLLVVLAGLGVAMVGLVTSQQASSNLDLQGARAYQAARAGLEWGLFQQTRVKACSATTTTPVTMPATSTLARFTVVVTCMPRGSAGVTQTVISAIACNIPDAQGTCGGSPNPEYVSRSVEAQL